MSEYVLGIDLGTSAVKVSAVDRQGKIAAQESFDYPLHQPQTGYSEQNPNDWVMSTTVAIVRLILNDHINAADIQGVSYSGQMHGLVLLDKDNQVLRPAILWNDTRTTKQCQEIEEKLGKRFVEITGNRPLEGFTLPKLLWVKENEPAIWEKATTCLLPKDYLRYRMTGKLGIDYTDATGTTLLDINTNQWSKELCEQFEIPEAMLPELIKSDELVGNVTKEYAEFSGLTTATKVFGGAADNAAGALGAGITKPGQLLSSIGTSGVLLKYEEAPKTKYAGQLQMEDHPDGKYYSMGVTLSAGYSLSWFKKTFCQDKTFTEMTKAAEQSSIGANGLIFTPYIVGERTPYADANIRGSFIGVDAKQERGDFARAVMEGIVFSFADLLSIYRKNNAQIKEIVSIGGGAKSAFWLQMQADIFNLPVVKLQNEQGPGMGAAILAATGLGWYASIAEAADAFVDQEQRYLPKAENVAKYAKIYAIYQQVYEQTKLLSYKLQDYKEANNI